MLNLDYNDEKDHFVDLYLDNENEVPDHYLGSVAACDNPLCDCHSIRLDLHNANKSHEEHSIWLNVRDRKDGGAAQECTDTIAFSERLAEQLTDKDWSELFLYYRRYKATISEDIEDIDSIEADFKDHTQGNLVSYKSILPLATPIAISNEGPSYLIGYDLYCPTPKCDCHSATLSVANLDEGSVHITEENSTTITVDFKKRKLKYVESRSENKNLPNPKEIISIINEQGDEIWDSLETRYNNVRRMYQNYLKRSGDKSNVSTVLPETKVKRNEPCPCGSGKKYKKCCLLAAV